MTAASSARAPANIITSGKTVLVIAPLRAWLSVKLPIILVPTVMHGPAFLAAQTSVAMPTKLRGQTPCRKRVHSLRDEHLISPTKGLTHYVIDQRLTSRP
jgi:hypothetical protein